MKYFQDRFLLSNFIGLELKKITYIAYKMPKNSKYKSFYIPKKTGGTRSIDAPIGRLKQIQIRIKHLIEENIIEKQAKYYDKNCKMARSISNGAIKKTSIFTNSIPHANKRFVFNIDIEDFFGSINYGRIYGILRGNNLIKASDRVASLIASLACIDNRLPQGSPCSPIMSDLVGQIIDNRMSKLARRHNCTYTRYIDDITFSTNERDFPAAIAKLNEEKSAWIVGATLEKEFDRLGFSLKLTKTRMNHKINRQIVTGLCVNKRPNIPTKYYKETRAMLNSLYYNDQYEVNDEVMSKLDCLEGRISYIYSIKNQAKMHYYADKDASTHSITNMLHRFYCLKYFCFEKIPILFTEGKTDVEYIRLALQANRKLYPDFFKDNEDSKELKIKFFSHKSLPAKILNYPGSTAYFPDFLESYIKFIRTRKQMTNRNDLSQSKIIFLFDDDQGLASVIGGLRKNKLDHLLAGNKIPNSNDPNSFLFLAEGAYLVLTPTLPGSDQSAIEDLFPADILNVAVDGKKFDRKKKHGDHSSLGKHLFAEKIVKPRKHQKDIFADFPILLDRIRAAMEHNV